MSLIYTPDGGVIHTQRKEIYWPPAFMRMLAIFAANCDDIGLGVRCELCKEPLHGQNAREDTLWKMECACRTYKGKNPVQPRFRKTH